MCGIIAIINGKLISEAKKLLKPIENRGFENYEISDTSKGVLGVNRLPIRDEKRGKQPFTNENKSIHVIMNGEIFNYEELKLDLIDKGHKILTNCDTELIPHLYEEYGEEFPKKIDSEMFTIVLIDDKNKKWIVVRDPIGVKPLYYTRIDEKTYFASEAKQLVGLKCEEILIFPPGEMCINGRFKKYFELKKEFDIEVSDKQLKKLRELFFKAVEKRVPSDLPVGVLLSGGIDSSAVLVAAKKYTSKITAFIIGKKGSPDRTFAERLCDEIGVKKEIIDPEEIKLEDVKEIVRILETDEWDVVKHSWAAYQVCKRMSKFNLKVALCGEGADEIFAGYNEFTKIPKSKENEVRYIFTKDLHLTQLQRVDRTSMHFTIEQRCPFMDTELVNFALSLRTAQYSGYETKGILKEALKEDIPSYILDRRKMPFSSGAGIGVGDMELRADVFDEVILNSGFKTKNFLKQLYEEYGYGKIKKHKAIDKNNLFSYLKTGKRLERPRHAMKI